jgi:multiple sugar transport system substrate-binding protein
MADVVDQYNSGQGKTDGVEVQMTLLSRQDTFSKEATLMAAKSSEQDIYFVASYNVGQFAASLTPLNSVDASHYFPAAIEGLQYQGEQYALPLDVSNHFLLYRKDLIDSLLSDSAQQAMYKTISAKVLGTVRAPKPADQWDLDDFKAMSAYFSKTENPDSPTQYGTILQSKNLLYNVMLWDDVLWGLGGSWTDADNKAALDTPEAQQAVQFYADIYTKKWASPDSAQAEFPETQAAIKSGSVAFALQWSAGFAELNDPAQSPDVAGKIAIAGMPGGKTHVHALAIALNKYSRNQAAATKFLSYLAQPAAMDIYAKSGGIPAMPQVLSDNQGINPVFAEVANSIDKYGYAEPVFPKSFDAYSQLAEDLSGAWVGSTPVADACATANKNLEALLAS